MTQQRILIVTIGPVQSFIAEARRTADLNAGSKILVELTRAIAQTIKQTGGELIYPASDDLEKADMPNKLVAVVNNPQQVADETRNAMLETWRGFVAGAFKEMNVKLNLTLNNQREIEVRDADPSLAEIIKRQLNHHLEFYWVAAAFDGSDEGYEAAYKKTDSALVARKQSRDFNQAIETGFKDSLSGTRSAFRTEGDKDARVYWERIRKAHPHKLQPGELLDTLGVIKRFGQSKAAPSTSAIAASSFARACAAESLLNDVIYAITSANLLFELFHPVPDLLQTGFMYDGDLLYRETYTPQNLANRYNISRTQYDKHKPDIDRITHALTNLYDRVDKAGIKPSYPSPYYAILQMDGDSMGKHVSQCKTMADHKKLSQILSDFTQAVKVKERLVEDHGGYLIYAGGDDVLALFPANQALAAAEALAKKYRELFETWPHGHKDENGKDFPFTASAGIAFAHHLYPLDGALAAARQAEKRAKNQHGRNALSVTVLRRSGETSEMGGKWAGELWREKPAPNTVEMVVGLIKLLEADQTSTRFPSSVLRDAEVVTMINDPSARKSILQQLLKRHRTEKLPDDRIQPLIDDWVTWANAHDAWATVTTARKCQENGEKDKSTSTQGFAELARWFGLARWLAIGGQE